MTAIDTLRSFYLFIKGVVSSTAATKLVLESSIEDVQALMKLNGVCVAMDENAPITPEIIIGNKRVVRASVHVIHSDAVVALALVDTITSALTNNVSTNYYSYSSSAKGTQVPSYRVTWDRKPIQFAKVPNEFNVAYWMCELHLAYTK